MTHDLAHYLTPEFKGEYLDRYVPRSPSRACRSITWSALSTRSPTPTSSKRINDGLPETLPEWIAYNGLTHLKIKLNGDDLKWDVDRVLGVDRVAAETQHKRGVAQWFYSLDFNEKCPNVDYLLEFLRQVKEKTPAGFERIQYIEQPTGARPEGPPRQRDARGRQAATRW